jgi:hypothetical protein
LQLKHLFINMADKQNDTIIFPNKANKTISGDFFINASSISKLFFYWGYKLLNFSKFAPLKNETLGKLEGLNKSENYMKQVFETTQKDKNHGLLYTTLIANRGENIF